MQFTFNRDHVENDIGHIEAGKPGIVSSVYSELLIELFFRRSKKNMECKAWKSPERKVE